MTDRMWIALAAVVFLIAAVGFCVWWFLPRRDEDEYADWIDPRTVVSPETFDALLADLDDDTTDEQWADELHQIALDLPGGVAPAPAAGEHHCAVCGQVHDDETRLDPDWFGRWELEQAEWMAGFRKSRNEWNEWLAAA